MRGFGVNRGLWVELVARAPLYPPLPGAAAERRRLPLISNPGGSLDGHDQVQAAERPVAVNASRGLRHIHWGAQPGRAAVGGGSLSGPGRGAQLPDGRGTAWA